MVVIGLLAACVSPQYLGVVSKSGVQAACAQIDAFVKALVTYRWMSAGYVHAAGLNALMEAPAGMRKCPGS